MRLAIDRCIEAYNLRLEPGETPMTQALLAESLGLCQSTISRWQSGERALTVKNAKQLAEILACSLEDLLHLPTECHVGMAGCSSESGQQ